MSSPFRFKQFSISQEYSPMKVGTDSVLLGAWTPATNPTYILDIGAGTGVLSLMMAQRFPLSPIHAVELHSLSAKECRLNVSLSPWHQAVEVFEMDIRDFASTSATAYDLIISNPPFFSENTLSPDRVRAMARSNEYLPFSDLLSCIPLLLAPQGFFSVIIPYREEESFLQIAMENGLFPTQILHVQGNSLSPIKRSLLLLRAQESPLPIAEKLIIEKERHQYTQEYQELTKNFYLQF